MLGLAKKGFFLPYRYAASVRPMRYEALEPLFAAHAQEFSRWIDRADRYQEPLLAMKGPAPRPRFDQGWFPGIDAALAYTMVRELKPRRIVEVGSGHSTRFLAAAIADQALDTRMTCIDPQPRAALVDLPITWHKAVLQDIGPKTLALEPEDILFIDSSHLLMPGTDVDHLIGRILPALPAGVVIHIHDIFLPDSYPVEWQWRGYNEQAAIAALLQGGAYRPLFSSHYTATRMADKISRSVLRRVIRQQGAAESSLWLQKTATRP